jgi:L-iditol 2-dehydrogenase
MRAGYLVEPGRVEIREADVPEAQPGGLVVRVRVALTDGTDLKAFRRGHPLMPMPTRFGHEFSGDVASVGEGVTTFSVGDPIMMVQSAPDGTCFWCTRGQEELCETLTTTMIFGAYAEYIALPPNLVARNAYRKPDDVSYEAGAFLEPVSCVVHSLGALGARRGDIVAIVGDGGFGILHALVALAQGARPILVGRRPARLELARSLGVNFVVNAKETDPIVAIRDLTHGRGADAVIETTGTLEVWEAAPQYVRRGGTVVLFGGLRGGSRVTYDAARLHYDEVKLTSPFHFTPRDVRTAFDLIATGAIDVVPLISERFSLAELAGAFQRLDEDRGINLKFAILP